MKQFLGLTLFALAIICLTSFANRSYLNDTNQFLLQKKSKPVGISIVLYRVGKADKIDELSNVEKQMDKSKSVNLYKITEDLGIIFMNTDDPYSDMEALPYIMLFGNYVEKQVGHRVINGFVSTQQVGTICEWIKKNKIEHFEGFSKIYDNLSKEAKQALEDIGAGDKKELFEGYAKPLTQFYFDALKDKNSVVICGE
jgi:hypothetical protein